MRVSGRHASGVDELFVRPTRSVLDATSVVIVNVDDWTTSSAAGRPSIHPSVRLSIFPLSPFVLPVSAADMTPWPGEVIEMRHGVHWPHQLSIKLTARSSCCCCRCPCRRIFNACHGAFVKSCAADAAVNVAWKYISLSLPLCQSSTLRPSQVRRPLDVISETTMKAYRALVFSDQPMSMMLLCVVFSDFPSSRSCT